MAFGNVVSGNTLVDLYDTWKFAMLSLGALLSVFLVCFPPLYHKLDHTSPEMKLLNAPVPPKEQPTYQ
jgi:hypothetical protein